MKFTFKDVVEESRLIKKRIVITAALIVLLLLFIIARLFYLQVINQSYYSTLSQNNRVKVLPIPPIRGLIYSRNGVLLADNQPAFSLEIIPERVKKMDQLLAQLSQLIAIQPEDIKRFNKEINQKRRFESIPLRYNLEPEEVARVAINNHRFPAVEIVARPYRRYPFKDLTAHAIGYVGRIDENDLKNLDESNYLGTTHTGKSGIEKSYEDILHGMVGNQQVEVNAQGKTIRVLERTSPIPGKNLYLSLDISLQQVAAQALQGRRGAIVAMDPNNGDVLAFVSSPGYDPNPFVNGIDSKSYKALLESPDKPLVNRVLRGSYPPGSTIKPFMGAIGLANHVRTSEDSVWCPGWFSLPGSTHRYRDWKKGGHGHADLRYAIMQSCDVYFYSLANDLGINRLHQGLSAFGFGKATGIDIKGESTGLNPSPEWKRRVYNQPWYGGETLIAGIGQGSVLATPIQLVRAVASIANDGMLLAPHLVMEARDVITGEISQVTHPEPVKVSIYTPEIWQKIRQAMEAVVHDAFGTARRSGLNAPYHFAGKTGTAQVIGIGQDERYNKNEIPEHLQDHALFIAFAPVESPRIAVAIMVENGGSGSGAAAPIARIVFDKYLLNIDPEITDGTEITGATVTH